MVLTNTAKIPFAGRPSERGLIRDTAGQTSLEYLMLLALAFITAYIVIRGPMAQFTVRLLGNIVSGISNLVTNAEWTTDDLQAFQGNHPSSAKRLKPLHL